MKSLEIFSGAGGLAHGLERAGFKNAAFVEINKHACASLRANFDPEKIFEGDIRTFDFGRLRDIDIVAGGPPCQPFSLGGKHRAYADSRDMFPYAARAIEHLMPKAFIFENVKGLLRSSFAEYFEYILLRLTYPSESAEIFSDWKAHFYFLKTLQKTKYVKIKYDVTYKLLNAADYGVPQIRERVIIVGIRSDLGINWAFPNPTHSEERLVWDMHISKDYWRRHGIPPAEPPESRAGKIIALNRKYSLSAPETLPWQTVRDALAGIPDPQTGSHGIPDHIYRNGARSYPGHTGSFIDLPAKTIKAGGHGVPGGENMIRYEDGRVRYLTVFEAKRLQSFPDGYRIAGMWGEAMRQIGNAVPILLAAQLGKHLIDAIRHTR
ncbi:MAG: DNA cytosine methyltransferase [Azoarcus sp.]|jgi:DNA (cytosine-5)-methyltransferase 1|nr:DNA cytosine methyltransferase [Azoarcus sp.]